MLDLGVSRLPLALAGTRTPRDVRAGLRAGDAGDAAAVGHRRDWVLEARQGVLRRGAPVHGLSRQRSPTARSAFSQPVSRHHGFIDRALYLPKALGRTTRRRWMAAHVPAGKALRHHRTCPCDRKRRSAHEPPSAGRGRLCLRRRRRRDRVAEGQVFGVVLPGRGADQRLRGVRRGACGEAADVSIAAGSRQAARAPGESHPLHPDRRSPSRSASNFISPPGWAAAGFGRSARSRRRRAWLG